MFLCASLIAPGREGEVWGVSVYIWLASLSTYRYVCIQDGAAALLIQEPGLDLPLTPHSRGAGAFRNGQVLDPPHPPQEFQLT